MALLLSNKKQKHTQKSLKTKLGGFHIPSNQTYGALKTELHQVSHLLPYRCLVSPLPYYICCSYPHVQVEGTEAERAVGGVATWVQRHAYAAPICTSAL